MATIRQIEKRLEAARNVVRNLTFGTPEFESAMVKVRLIYEEHRLASPPEEFCSVDSGVHRTRLSSGRII